MTESVLEWLKTMQKIYRNILLLMLVEGLNGSLVSLLTLATPLCAQNLIASSQTLSQNLVTLPVSATVLGAFDGI